MAIAAGLIVGLCASFALAETDSGRVDGPAALIGVAAYSADGQEMGTVSAVTMTSDGTITEIRVTTSSPLGLGERTVAIDQDDFSVLDGAVVLALSAAEVDALPTSRPAERMKTRA